MEAFHPPKEVQEKVDNSDVPEKDGISEKWLREKINSLIPIIQNRWPNIAQQTLETAKGSIDDLVVVIAGHTGSSTSSIKNQLFEIIDSIQENNWDIAKKIEPIVENLNQAFAISPYSMGTSSVIGEFFNKFNRLHLLMGHGMIPSPQCKEMEKELYQVYP